MKIFFLFKYLDTKKKEICLNASIIACILVLNSLFNTIYQQIKIVSIFFFFKLNI